MASYIHIIKICSLIIPWLLVVHCQKNRCLMNYKVPEPQYLHYNERTLDFTLKASNNIGHQLTTEVLKIFLEEILGYRNIKIVQLEETKSYSKAFENILYSYNPLYETIPAVLVDINVPITPEMDLQDLINLQTFTDIGNLSPIGRYAWFIPKQFTKIFPSAEYWKFFKDLSNAEFFNINSEEHMNLLTKNSINESTKRYFCEETFCKEGIYTPPHCMNNNQTCAFMLTSHPKETSFITSHIVELKLYMKVIWLGDNLRDVVDKLSNTFSKPGSKKSVIFMEWTPGYFTLNVEKFTSVSLPNCESFKSLDSIGCKYEMTRSAKLVWPTLQFIAKSAVEVIHKMRLDSVTYNDLMKSYKINNKNVHQSACSWMRQNADILDNWAPTSKRELYIGGIFPLTEGFYNPQGVATAAIMAQDAINKNSTILPGYDLKIMIKDGKCKSDAVMKVFIDYIYSFYYANLIGVLGPACSETVEPLAGLSKHYSTIVMSYSAEGSYFSDRSKYPYFFRTIGENRQYRHVYLMLFKQFGWKQVAALTEDGQKYTEYISSMGNLFQEHGISLISNSKFPREREESSMARYLEDLKKKSTKIIIADINDQVARIIICQAFKLKMTSGEGYVWFLPPWLHNDWYNTTHYNKYFGEHINCTIDEMKYTINGYFSLNYAYFAEDSQVMQENITVGEWKDNYKKKLATDIKMSKISSQDRKDWTSSYAGYAYDAVWTYALAADKLLKFYPKLFSNIHAYNTTQVLVKIIEGSDYNGVSGHIKFYGGASRFSTINIKQWINGEKVLVGNFYPEISSNLSEVIGGTLDLNMTFLTWFTKDNLQPDDGSTQLDDCMFSELAESLNISCSTAIIIVNIISFGMLGVTLSIALIIVKRKYDKKIRMTVEYMQSMGIDKQAIMNMTNLDKWETSRENVIINRKIGEGAFGTVYGGEAIIGEGWVPVAVKTLKVGSTTEQKLDFLSEAESMKRFDHKNIVKLLGVCTKNEPVLTIMEFMLYGDLKTYLLARRHLVNGKYQDESEEVSSRKLTAMALDVARALSYLAELKYVHRDIACRNCLVNSQRIVKVGDFGMTRLIFENDYYRFSRKGLLPVRWMAPESLGLGIFTPASDVWSFGVLLYEIITFGGFPFQGLSNNQVLEAVKEGKTLSIPKGVKPQLEGLMKSCWNREYKTRPQASEIAEFMANSPRLLCPCLDVPISSVQIEYPDEFEILPELMSGPRQAKVIPRDPTNKENDPSVINSLRFDNPNYVSGDVKLDRVFGNRKIIPNINHYIKETDISHDETQPFV